MCNNLSQYFGHIYYPDSTDLQQTFAGQLLSAVHERNDFDIVSFNYTNLSGTAFYMGLHDLDYSPIHGSALDDSIILGINADNNIKRDYCFLIKTLNPSYRQVDLADKLLAADEVIIFGHSCSEIDFHYFDEFFHKQSGSNRDGVTKKTIVIVTNNNESQISIYQQLQKHGCNYDYLSRNNTLKVFRTSDEDGNTREFLEYCQSLIAQ